MFLRVPPRLAANQIVAVGCAVYKTQPIKKTRERRKEEGSGGGAETPQPSTPQPTITQTTNTPTTNTLPAMAYC